MRVRFLVRLMQVVGCAAGAPNLLWITSTVWARPSVRPVIRIRTRPRTGNRESWSTRRRFHRITLGQRGRTEMKKGNVTPKKLNYIRHNPPIAVGSYFWTSHPGTVQRNEIIEVIHRLKLIRKPDSVFR
jgi:hypothetical protein